MELTIQQIKDKIATRIDLTSLRKYVEEMDSVKSYIVKVRKGSIGRKKFYSVNSLKEIEEYIKKRRESHQNSGKISKTITDEYLLFAKRKGVVFDPVNKLWNGKKVYWENRRLYYSENKVDVMKDWYDNYGISTDYKQGAVGRVVL